MVGRLYYYDFSICLVIYNSSYSLKKGGVEDWMLE